MDREYHTCWKENYFVAKNRQDLPTKQWTHRCKIYIEGYAWSVSEKYILACNSVTLMVIKPHYNDFFTRNLRPAQHHWPVNDKDKCKSTYMASEFMQEELKIEYVYDCMFHLLNASTKLLRYKPEIPEGAMEMYSETVAWPAEGRESEFIMELLMKSPYDRTPCSLPPHHMKQKYLGPCIGGS